MGEFYDARFEIPGWNLPAFDDRTWEPVQLNDVRVGKLEAYPTEPVRVITEIKPIEITEPKAGVFVFNMGQNIAGRIRLKVRGKAGTKIVIRYAEMLHPDGTVMTENLRRARATDTYILKGNNLVEIWEPRFTYHGFQYVEITGFPGQPGLETVTGVVLHSAMERTGFFSCSNPLIDRLYSNILWTQRSNFFEIPTDCPQRDERMGWSGDAQVFIRSATYNMNVASFISKWLLSLEDDQRPSGAFPDYAPMPFLLFEPSPGWMDAGIICPSTIYKVYGDTQVIDHHYQAMTKFMTYLSTTSRNYLRTPQYHSWGDWLSIDERTSDDLIATAFFAHDARLMSEMAAAIGRQQEAKKFATRG
jgi:alpha-L-rhamnosidase